VETPEVIWPCALPDAKPTVIKALKQMPIIQYCSTMHVKKTISSRNHSPNISTSAVCTNKNNKQPDHKSQLNTSTHHLWCI